jgi:hypothetical protein
MVGERLERGLQEITIRRLHQLLLCLGPSRAKQMPHVVLVRDQAILKLGVSCDDDLNVVFKQLQQELLVRLGQYRIPIFVDGEGFCVDECGSQWFTQPIVCNWFKE